VIEAAASPCVAASQGDAIPVRREDHTTVFAMLEERRANLAAPRVRAANQLHAVLRDLVPGGAGLAITAISAPTMVCSSGRHRWVSAPANSSPKLLEF
jgi:hypothetical protein